MNKPNDYDSVTPMTNDYKKVPAGAYKLGIVSAEITTTKNSNREMITLHLDIADGEFKNYYRELSTKLNKPCYLRYNQLTDGNSTPFFKGMVTSIEKSNQGYVFNFDEKTLARKFVGGMLQEKCDYNKNGELKHFLQVAFLCSVESALSGALKTPPCIMPEGFGDEQKHQGSNSSPPPEDDLPF